MPAHLPRIRLNRSRIIIASAVVAMVVGLIGWAAWPAPRPFTTSDEMLTVLSGPRGTEPVRLDTTLYLPDSASREHPVPAILLAHGFGGSKQSVVADAEDFAGRGYAVLTWTARGFGRSGGQIHLDHPDYEIRDAQRLLDWLAARVDIARDANGDPRVGVVGGSYGGALALMLAGRDGRVDAIVPMITWNDLANAFLPESTGRGPGEGVFKRQWAGIFFGNGGGRGLFDTASLGANGGSGGGQPSGDSEAPPGGGAGPTDQGSADAGSASSGSADPTQPLPPGLATRLAGLDPACGRFAREVCEAYLDVATTGRASEQTITLLHQSSPAPLLGNIKAPTLLIQGQADSLFPLSEAEANYRGIAATGTPVRVDWFTGGHDGGEGPRSDRDRLNYLTITWLDHYLRGWGEAPGSGFTYSRISGFDADTRRITTAGFSAPAYPGVAGQDAAQTITVDGPPQRAANPPDGNPGAISSLPGVGTGGLSSFVNGSVLEVPGQHADFYSAPLSSNVDVVGAPTVRIRAASPTGEAVLFVKLYDTDPGSGNSLPFGLTAPVRLTGLPKTIDEAPPVTVTLPTIVYRFEAGHRLRITASTSDQAFHTPVAPTVYTIAVPDGGAAVTLPRVDGSPIANPEVIWRYALAALAVFIAVAVLATLVLARVRRRHNAETVLAEYADIPLVVRGLRKEYADGFVAVACADFTVERGQVVGLLGPNGAGKTTSLRVLLGMTRPTRGDVVIFGHPLRPGAEVLTRVGALVEGPGFMPHVSGLDNLRLYWRSTGRPDGDARFDEALEIAGLGDAIHRKVRKYSHGMKQRLAIAQAMLGMPELLVLDEPTDGLDPPQIAEMRKVLRAYATNGRAVLVSSHLLAEVEQTCTHVVVMHKGEVVADGPVDEVVGDSPIAQFDVSDVDMATGVLGHLAGVHSVTPDGRGGLVVDLNGTARTDAVAALVRAGVGVDRVVPRRRLEDAFLALVGGDSKASGER